MWPRRGSRPPLFRAGMRARRDLLTRPRDYLLWAAAARSGRYCERTCRRAVACGYPKMRSCALTRHDALHPGVSGEWREGTSPSRSLRTVRDSLPSYGSHSPAFFCLGRSVGSSPEGLTSKRP